MKYYKTSNLSIQDNDINSIYFINELLYPLYNQNKYTFYEDKYESIRKNIINNDYDNNKINPLFFFNKNNIYILRKKDNKIIKVPKLTKQNSSFNYSFFIYLIKKSKKNPFYFCDSNNDTNQFKTINGILYLFYHL